jgi:hypothetical protein
VEITEPTRAVQVEDFWQGDEPFPAGGAYVNYLNDEGEERTRAAHSEGDGRRLVELERVWDPDNVFRWNQNTSPLIPADRSVSVTATRGASPQTVPSCSRGRSRPAVSPQVRTDPSNSTGGTE